MPAPGQAIRCSRAMTPQEWRRFIGDEMYRWSWADLPEWFRWELAESVGREDAALRVQAEPRDRRSSRIGVSS